MPFCQVSRLTSTNRGESSACRPKRASIARAVDGAALQLAGGEGRGEQRVGLGVPHPGVDAVDDAVQRAGAGGDQPVEAHAEGRRLDLLGIGRADGGDRARVGEAGLQVADAAVELDAVEARGLRRQLERGEDAGGEAALEGDVVDRHHRRPRHAVEAQVGGREARLPVVRVHEIGQELRHHPHGDVGGGAAERAEAAPVVRVVGAARVAIGAAGTVVERRAVDDDELEPLDLGGEEPRGHAEQRRIVIDDAGVPELRHHRRIAGDERAHLDAAPRQRRRQRAGDVGQPAGLDQRIDLGGDREDPHQAHTPRQCTRHPPAKRAAARPRAAEKRPPGGRSAAARARGPGGTVEPARFRSRCRVVVCIRD